MHSVPDQYKWSSKLVTVLNLQIYMLEKTLNWTRFRPSNKKSSRYWQGHKNENKQITNTILPVKKAPVMSEVRYVEHVTHCTTIIYGTKTGPSNPIDFLRQWR